MTERAQALRRLDDTVSPQQQRLRLHIRQAFLDKTLSNTLNQLAKGWGGRGRGGGGFLGDVKRQAV